MNVVNIAKTIKEIHPGYVVFFKVDSGKCVPIV